jgi:glycosyltransferase involved in cell wall biosynthesis
VKITIIANGFQEDYIINLVNSLALKGIEVDLIGSSFYNRNKINPPINFLCFRGDNNDKASLLRKVLRIIKYYFRLIIYLMKTKSEIIHVQWLKFYLIEGVIFVWIYRILGKKAFYTVQDVLPHNKETKLNWLIFYLIYHSQHCIIAHTEFIRNRLISEFEISPEKVKVINHGVYLVDDNSKIDKLLAREFLGLPEHDFVLLLFGIITKYKGLDLLLDAFTRLKELDRKVTLLIAGKISNDYIEEFRHLIDSFPSDKIVKKTEYIPDDLIEYIFKAVDLTVLPYREASQSGVLFMSYAYGTPVIGPKLGGFPNDILVGKTGYLFDPEDSISLLNSIILAKESLFGKENYMKKHIIDYANEKYSWNSSAKALINLYMYPRY